MDGYLIAVKESVDGAGHIFEELHITSLCGYSGKDW
jgi:hypothetical protein